MQMLHLKDRPMAVQIWIILGIILGLSLVLLSILFPVVLKRSFTTETYARIEESQEYILKYDDIEEITGNIFFLVKPGEGKNQPPFRIVRHILLSEDIPPVRGELSGEILQQMGEEAETQQEDIKHYFKKIDHKEIFYIIRQIKLNSKDAFLVSYLWERYRDNLVESTFKRLIGLLIFILLISWIASIAIARYLTRPLVRLQSRVKDMALRKWDNPVSLNRGDEIGKLGETIDWMRLQLLEHEQKQQSFLQQVSHELKTPVMVIRSYVQSITDGIFPRGDMESSLKVIEEETERLEKRVHFLLGYTKYEYLAKHKLEKERFDLTVLIKQTVNNFMWLNPDLKWELDLEDIYFEGDREKLKIALENILDNQIRYAEKVISISLKEKEGSSFALRIWNDGPEITEFDMVDLFSKFRKGYEGNFGLGLAIVKLVVELHGGRVLASNEEGGVAFYLEI
jgi:two-component system, OmpR family, sensor histidine kinase CssS